MVLVFGYELMSAMTRYIKKFKISAASVSHTCSTTVSTLHGVAYSNSVTPSNMTGMVPVF